MSERFTDLVRRERSRLVAREAARELEENGCFHIRIEDIARRSGIAKGTVYQDFGGKGSLLSSALSDACEQLLQTIDARIGDLGSPEDRLREGIYVLSESAVGPAELRVLIERRLSCAVRWFGGDTAPYERLEQRLAELIEGSSHRPDRESSLTTAQALLAVASTPRAQRLAFEHGPRALAEWLLGVASALTYQGSQPGK